MAKVNLTYFLFGALGGSCPTLAKLASTYSTNPTTDMPNFGIFIGLGLFALLGGIVAVGFGASDLKGSLVSGIAAPGLITNIVAGANPSIPDDELIAQLTTPFFFSSAYAQNADTNVVVTNERLLTIMSSTKGDAPENLQLEYGFTDQDGNELPIGGTFPSKASRFDVIVPDNAEFILINGILHQLPKDSDQLSLEIDAAPTIVGDLFWAFGAQRQFEVKDIILTPIQP